MLEAVHRLKKKLKAAIWNGSDDYSFSVLPAGMRTNYDSFMSVHSSARFWTSREESDYRAYYLSFEYLYDYIAYRY